MRVQEVTDKLGVAMSTVCLIHCALLPVFTGLIPYLYSTQPTHEEFHSIALPIVAFIAVVGVSLGCRKHKNKTVAFIALIGISLITFGTIAGHDILGETWEKITVMSGSLFICTAHVKNYKLCRHTKCNH